MEFIEHIKDIISSLNEENWYCLRISQDNIDDPEFSIVKEYRSLVNSTKSCGNIQNRQYVKRHMSDQGGVWIKLDNYTILVYFIGKKQHLDTTTFIKHLTIRYYKSCRKRPNMIVIPVKSKDNKTVFDIMNEHINSEVNNLLDSNQVPQIKVSLFGKLWGNKSKK